MSPEVFLGIDVGSVTTKLAALGGDDSLLAAVYLPTAGTPKQSVAEGLRRLRDELGFEPAVRGAAATGSGRHLVGPLVGVDILGNEITCQAIASVRAVPGVRTIIEIGGQDSKLIFIRDGLVTDFAMNTVCAAGTGSFLDHQAARLRLGIEEFSRRAVAAETPAVINGRCTVFAESDMIHRQQAGEDLDSIIYGLCLALVRNYLADVSRGKEIVPPVVFQGGVAFNGGIVRALKAELGLHIIVPRHHEVMGAVGAALLAQENAAGRRTVTGFKGFILPGEGNVINSTETPAGNGVE